MYQRHISNLSFHTICHRNNSRYKGNIQQLFLLVWTRSHGIENVPATLQFEMRFVHK